MANDIVATITRMLDGGAAGQCQIVVRSSTLSQDTAIRVSREEYGRLQPGMLVTVFMIGWGPLSAWRLRR